MSGGAVAMVETRRVRRSHGLPRFLVELRVTARSSFWRATCLRCGWSFGDPSRAAVELRAESHASVCDEVDWGMTC